MSDSRTAASLLATGMVKPPRLRRGDTVATVSLSWGGAGKFPERYNTGKRQLQDEFGLRVIECPHTMADPDWLWRNPRARADDLMTAFADPAVRGIVSTIGGDDSIRLLPYLDLQVIRSNPKVVLGFSDTTICHMACFKAGLVSFYGPAIMAGFAENGGLFPYMVAAIRRTLFEREPVGIVEPNQDGWTAEVLNWDIPENQNRRRTLHSCEVWNWLQGTGVHRGHLLGGCFEVFDWLRGTEYWPSPESWRGAILFLETSEDAPPPSQLGYALRVYGAMGVLQGLSAILLGRPGGDIPPRQFDNYDRIVQEVTSKELGLTDLPIITGMDFGHTDPMFVLPYGVLAEVDCNRRLFSILESGVADGA